MKKYLYEDLYQLEEHHWWHKIKREKVSSWIKGNTEKKHLKILDIGCGTGKNIESLQQFGEVWGIDNAKEAVYFCKKRNLKNIIVASSYKMPFQKDSFDGITMLDVLEHVDEEKTLKEIYRILKPGGFLIISVPAFSWLWSQWDVVLHHKRRYTIASLGTALSLYTFKVKDITYMYSFLIIPAFLVRKIKEIIFQKQYPSDFKIGNLFINNILHTSARIEGIIAEKMHIPFGTSIFCVAVKK